METRWTCPMESIVCSTGAAMESIDDGLHSGIHHKSITSPSTMDCTVESITSPSQVHRRWTAQWNPSQVHYKSITSPSTVESITSPSQVHRRWTPVEYGLCSIVKSIDSGIHHKSITSPSTMDPSGIWPLFHRKFHRVSGIHRNSIDDGPQWNIAFVPSQNPSGAVELGFSMRSLARHAQTHAHPCKSMVIICTGASRRSKY
jgi:hypothetical protein